MNRDEAVVSDTITSVLIVGGGTSGWMTASYLSKAMPDLKVTLIESNRVNRIGVGEATFSTVRHFFDYLGLEEHNWLPKCAGSYKLGIKFRNWSGDGGHFYSSFERWEVSRGFSHPEWWLKKTGSSDGFDYASFLIPNLCKYNLSPRQLDGSLFAMGMDGPLNKSTLSEQSYQFPYAYHFDADKVAEFLAEYSLDNGVSRIIDSVTSVELNEDGWVSGVSTECNGILSADLYIDCSGFRGLIIGGALKEKFVSFSDVLANDRAVALRVPRPETHEVEPYTTAMTMSSGWRWTIPLHERNGYGYVYSEKHISPENAEKELRESIPFDTSACAAAHIAMNIGRRERSWVNNCVAIGLSGSFVEPLESTGIFFIQHGIEQLVKFFPDKNWSPDLQEAYNSRINNAIDGIKEFLILHFHLAKRDDTPYWNDAKQRQIPEDLLKRLSIAKIHLLDSETVYPHYHGFEPYSWNTMILGLGGGPTAVRPAMHHLSDAEANAHFDRVSTIADTLRRNLPTCYEYLQKTHKKCP